MISLRLKIFYSTALIIVILAAPGFLFLQCMRNLCLIEHAINCPSTVLNEKNEGNIDEEGNWITNRWLSLRPAQRMLCPATGKQYSVPLEVGQHPYCLTHGRLVELSGYVPHSSSPRFTFFIIVGVIFLPTVLIVPLSALLVYLWQRRKCQRKNPDSVADMPA